MKKQRKTREQRIDEIMEAATKVFTEKGYSKTTMEDIIEETDLSKGGFYHYYSSTKDILIDMMGRGNMHYMHYNPYMQQLDATMALEQKADLFLEAYLDKALVTSKEKKIYAMFLFEGMYDEDLWLAFLEYEKAFMAYMFDKLGLDIPEDLSDFYFLSRMLNGLLIGQHTTRETGVLLAYKETLKEMLMPLALKLVQ
jgi:AcrR family transcriptional regulator